MRSVGTSNIPDVGCQIQQTQDGGFVVAGLVLMQPSSYTNINAVRLWIIKLDALGGVEWEKTYSGDEKTTSIANYPDSARIVQTRDDGYIVATTSATFGAGGRDIWILKLQPDGEIAWQKAFGGPGNEDPKDVRQTADGGFIVAGSASFSDNDFWILKLDSKGNVEWQKAYGDADSEYAEAVQQTEDGGYIISGSKGFGGRYGCWVIKTTPVGAVEWQRLYGYAERSTARFARIEKTTEGGFVLIDTTDRFGAGARDIQVLKLSKNGAIEWQRAYGGGLDDYDASEIHQAPDGGYITAATTHSFRWETRLSDLWVLKLDGAGRIEWQKTYGTEDRETVGNIIPTEDGCFAFVGTTYSDGAHRGDLFVGKIDALGNAGPCDQGQITSGKCVDTAIVAVPTYVIPISTDAGFQETTVMPGDLKFDAALHCWNLHQPPENLTLTEQINRGLFKQEKYFLLQWMPNDYNRSFDIAEYRLYRNDKLIASLASTVLGYSDLPLDADARYYYGLTAVDAQGRESPRSATVAR